MDSSACSLPSASFGGLGSARQRPARLSKVHDDTTAASAWNVEVVEHALCEGLCHEKIGLVVKAGEQASLGVEIPSFEVQVSPVIEQSQESIQAA